MTRLLHAIHKQFPFKSTLVFLKIYNFTISFFFKFNFRVLKIKKIENTYTKLNTFWFWFYIKKKKTYFRDHMDVMASVFRCGQTVCKDIKIIIDYVMTRWFFSDHSLYTLTHNIFVTTIIKIYMYTYNTSLRNRRLFIAIREQQCLNFQFRLFGLRNK